MWLCRIRLCINYNKLEHERENAKDKFYSVCQKRKTDSPEDTIARHRAKARVAYSRSSHAALCMLLRIVLSFIVSESLLSS